jgi:Mg2+ and Co2+ transporter CorA
LEALKREGRVKVMMSNAFFFLFKDGTLISFHQGDRSFGNQIYQRLRHSEDVLRKEPEQSLLLEALLDLIVDQAFEVVDKYGDKINECEEQVLLRPNMEVVRKCKDRHLLGEDMRLTYLP